MIFIVAAMEEELKTCMDLCKGVRNMPGPDVPMWQARTAGGTPLAFLRAGVGPEKSTARIRKAFDWIDPDLMLIAGYAGALDPDLKIGDLVAVTSARAFGLNRKHPDWNHVEANDPFNLTHVDSLMTVRADELSIFKGSVLSSRHVLGNPEHKNLLFHRFQASVVDMETAFLVREAAARKIPVSALRVISDTAHDSFLEPFERDPDLKLTDRARKLLRSGPVSSLREWKNRTAAARAALRRFWEIYLGRL
jgi:adenosylhomocysteine nucleosidase